MTWSQYDGTAEPGWDAVPASRLELLALHQALQAFFSQAPVSEVPTQAMEAHLCACIQEGLARTVSSREPVTIDLSTDDVLTLAIVASTMTVPYRAGLPQALEATALSATLTPLAERLLVLVEQIRRRERIACHQTLDEATAREALSGTQQRP